METYTEYFQNVGNLQDSRTIIEEDIINKYDLIKYLTTF